MIARPGTHDVRCVCPSCGQARRQIAAARIADGAMRRLINGSAKTVAEALESAELEHRLTFGDPGAKIPREMLDKLNVKVGPEP